MTAKLEIIQGEFFGEKIQNWEVRRIIENEFGYEVIGNYDSLEEAQAVQIKDMGSYVLTAEPTMTPNGDPAFRMYCTCATHKRGSATAIVRTVSGKPNWKTGHGNVTLANHPILGKATAKKGDVFPG